MSGSVLPNMGRLLCLSQLRIEAPDPQPDQCCFHTIDEPALLANRLVAQHPPPAGYDELELGRLHDAPFEQRPVTGHPRGVAGSRLTPFMRHYRAVNPIAGDPPDRSADP
jgi:hypothetical protein